MDWFQIGKGACQGCILSPCLFNFYAEYIMENARLDEAQARIKIARRNINNLRYAGNTTLRQQRGTKEPLDESERGEWKSWVKTQHSENLNHGIWSYHFMTNRWGNNGYSDKFIFLGSKITEDGDCSYEIKRHLLLGRKVMTNLDSILKAETLLCRQRSV